ncbi:MAG: tetratricopeptide repeat protein [Nitrospirae bacterium]|nr:tetratricopeptide repeat protein [Nitrospirota bacterium]
MENAEEACNVTTSNKISLLHKPTVHILLIVIIGLIAYSKTFHVPFYFDDINNIVKNSFIKDLRYFTEPSKAKTAGAKGIEYYAFKYDGFKNRFIGFLTFALNYKLHGLNVTGYHIVNLAIHLLNALLIYRLVLLTFQTPYFRCQSVKVSECQSGGVSESQSFDTLILGYSDTKFVALFSSLLFVSHPIQTQAVTYIIQRLTSLSTLFYLLSLVMYVKFKIQNTDKRQKIFSLSSVFWYLTSVLSAVLAMKTKEIAFTLPIIITLYEIFFFNPKLKTQNPELETLNSQTKACGYISRLTPYALRFLYLTPFLLTLLIIPISHIGAPQSAGDLIGEVSETVRVQTTMSRVDYLFTQFRVIITYIRLLFLPVNQNLDYDYPVYHSFFEPNVFLSFLFLLSILGLGVYLFYYSKTKQQTSDTQAEAPYQVRGRLCGYTSCLTPHVLRLTAFGVFWFFITLSVESSVIPIVDVIFEHRLYLPSVGAFIAIITLIFFMTKSLKNKWHLINNIITTGLTLIIITFTWATYSRNTVWQDEIVLWENVIKKSPNKARGYNELGIAYMNREIFDKATSKFQIAIELDPHFTDALHNLATVYSKINMFAVAIEMYNKVLNEKPDLFYIYNNLGVIYFKLGQFDKAFENYTKAITINPYFAEPYNNRGIIYARIKKYINAIEDYTKAITLDPTLVESYTNRGNSYDEEGLPDKALNDYTAAITINPKYADAYFNRGVTYFHLGNTASAMSDFQKSCDLGIKKGCEAL